MMIRIKATGRVYEASHVGFYGWVRVWVRARGGWLHFAPSEFEALAGKEK